MGTMVTYDSIQLVVELVMTFYSLSLTLLLDSLIKFVIYLFYLFYYYSLATLLFFFFPLDFRILFYMLASRSRGCCCLFRLIQKEENRLTDLLI